MKNSKQIYLTALAGVMTLSLITSSFVTEKSVYASSSTTEQSATVDAGPSTAIVDTEAGKL